MENKKYKLGEKHPTLNLYRVIALKNFGFVCTGDVGGYIERESNLSHVGNCWIHGNAEVYDNARVFGNAEVYDNAWVFGNAEVYDNARVFGDARVFGNAVVYDYAHVFGDVKVFGDAQVLGNAVITQDIHASRGYIKSDLTRNKAASLRAQLGVTPFNGTIVLYKRVNQDLTDEYTGKFQYPERGWVEEKDAEISDRSCASGLHFSHAEYYSQQEKPGSKILVARIHLDDIITVQHGKVRCKRAFICGIADAINEYEKED